MKTKVIFPVLVLFAVHCLLITVPCLSAVPSLINYQGVLKDSSGVPYNNPATMIFSIWDDSTNGNKLWEETHPVVEVSHGLFNVLLGGVDNPIPDSVFEQPSAWLDVLVNGSQLSPRRRIASVGYAFTDGDWTINGDNIYRIQGNVGMGTAQPDYKLVLQNGSYFLSLDPNIGFEQDIIGHSQLALQSGAGNDIVFRDGNVVPGTENVRILGNGNVGIGTTMPDEKLTVDGNAHITGDLTVDGTINPTPTEGHYSIPPIEFVQYSGNPGGSYLEYQLRYALVGMNAGNWALLYAPIHLPHGATTGKVVIYYFSETDMSYALTVYRHPFPASEPEVMGAVLQETGSGSVDSLILSTVSNPIIDNAQYRYKLVFNATSLGGTTTRIYGARIEYNK